MGRRKLPLNEEQEKIRKKGKMKETVTVEDDEEDSEEEDDDGLDEFENDGFIVDNVEEEEEEEGEGENPKQTPKKIKRRRSLKNIVLDEDDLELIRENKSINEDKLEDRKFKRLKKAGINTELGEYFSDDEGSLFNDLAEEDEHLSNDTEDMADFIVDEGVKYEKRDPLGQSKFEDNKWSSSLLKEAKYSFGKAGLLQDHGREVQIQSTKLDEPDNDELLIPTNVHVAGEGDYIDDTDIPERMKIIEDIVGSAPVDKISIEEESSWIFSQLVSNINPFFNEANSCRLVDSVKREDIVRFFELHHAEKYDIPFIAMYRKEQCISLLEGPLQDESGSMSMDDNERKPQLKWHKILWIIKELDKKWLLLQKRKSTLMRYYNKHFVGKCQMTFLDEESSFHKQIFESITNMLEKAETEREIDYIDMKFNLHFPPVNEFFDSGYKRPVMKSYYFNCSRAGLRSLASKFGNPEKFCSLLTLEKVGLDNEEDPEESPEELASIYKCETFETSEAVLKGARHMATVELSSEITFRKYVHNIFMDKALVSTSPTLEGDKAIDSFHEFAAVKWLQDKPLSKFDNGQWLFIQKAEEEKLLQVKIKLPDNALNELTMTCNDAYLKDNAGISARLWNEQRKSILQDAISNFLLPSMEKEARALLNAKAKNWLLMEYGMHLWNRVSVAPYQYKDSATVQEQVNAPRVMACCWGIGKPGTAFVMLDSKGELVDVIHAGSLSLRSQNINDQQRRKNDQERVLKFLTTHQPHVIVLGAANASCMRLKSDITEIISMMSEDNFQDVSQEIKQLPAVVLGDESLPRLYEDSEISMNQVPRQHGIVKRAVALGRYLLNPLAMVATLCGVKKEVLSWKLNPLEKFLTSDEKLEIIEWIMVDITNQVGIDINLAIGHDWLLAPLQFVSGLGPRKAGILHKELLGGTDIRNRRDFAKYGLNTRKVFCNAVGFLKVSYDDPNFVDTAGNILDRTRIHPESYHLAEELARAVYNLENPNANATQVNVMEYIQDDPKLLESFDLNDYADRLEIEQGESKRVTLHDIKMELLHGFKDPRRPFKEPNQDEEFYLITGETGDVLAEGKRVQVIVRHVQSQQAFCVLDSGMTGVLSTEDFSDETEDIPLTDKLREGVVLTCKIKLIDMSRCRVNLTCKASELNNNSEQSFRDIDPYYCQGNIIFLSQPEATKKKQHGNKHFIPRTIFHPHFQNITADQAKEFLADKAIGEHIFHPSSRGPHYLALTLKVFDGLYVHKDIVESGKNKDIKGLLGLGETLKIGEEIFENIEKVIERYVNPLVVQLKAMLNFRKFKKGSKAEIDELLRLEKEEYPKRIPYGICISYEHPGTFILSYIRSTNPHHEFIGIHPKGFKFRKQIFENVEQLVAYFQNHVYDDNVVTAKTPTTDGLFKESSIGGWRNENVDQRKKSIGYNVNGDGDGRGSGRGRGHCGRGFSPRSGSCDDGNVKHWGVRGSREGNDSGTTNFSHKNLHESGMCVIDNGSNQGGFGHGHERNTSRGGWGSTGSDQTKGGSWANANFSGWNDNTGKSWGQGGSSEGSDGGTTNFSRQNSDDCGRDAGRSFRGASGDSGWEQGRGRGRGRRGSRGDGQGRGRGRRGSEGDGQGRGRGRRESQGDDGQGCGYDHDKNHWSSYSGQWGNAGSDRSGGGDNQGRGRGRRGSQGDAQGRGWGRRGSRGDGQGRGWGRRGSRGDGQGRGWGRRESQDEGQGCGYEHDKNLSSYSGKWGSSGSDHSGCGGWANANSSGCNRWGGNSTNEERSGFPSSSFGGVGKDNSEKEAWGPSVGTDSNTNSGWSVDHGRNVTSGDGRSGWGGIGGSW